MDTGFCPPDCHHRGHYTHAESQWLPDPRAERLEEAEAGLVGEPLGARDTKAVVR